MKVHPFDGLSAYVDGALSPEAATEIAIHLAGCAHCRAVVRDLLAIKTLVRSLPHPSPHPAALPRTLARLDGREAGARVIRRGRIAVVSAAAAAAVFALLLQVPVPPAPVSDRTSSVMYFQTHAELTLTHPMTDVTLASYLSSPFPYDPIEEPASLR